MKKLSTCIAALSTLAVTGLTHGESFDTAVGRIDSSMSVTLASDYIWRGQSQTAGKGAIQGSLDISHESGLFIGTWASNVDDEAFGGASVEWDYYAGYAGDITDALSYDLTWAAYEYPGGDGDTTYEVIGSLSFNDLTVGTKYAYHPSSAIYGFVGYDIALPYETTLGLHYGYTDTKDSLSDVESGESYQDWAVSLSKTVIGLDLALMYSDTSLKNGTCEEWYGKATYCDSNVTVSVARSF
ncbi:lipoprotein [Pseudomonas saudimassiliensis]|uniref:Lipoprotein n=1 Tax=Pseudomonas saudimassiliensis TaxID=1461581 RepID=A0A078MJ30_9PSED|nr:TorF family putative porin [Pseudomonas saudimassiliensis]CEA06270.1 lipoprotein [Pseudomonas saudimassiliensis]CEF27695.1 lipoprotein [Pseudomonas saudimassiliensis]